MKKIINYIKDHWIFILISIVVTLSGLIDLVTKYLKGHTITLSFIRSVLKESAYFYGQKFEIIRVLILIPWVITISLCIVVAKDYFKNKRGYKDVPIYFIGKKLIVRFWDSSSSKEYANARIICGYCKILFEELRHGPWRCPRCGLGYNPREVDLIIAEARSIWITGKRQKGYIKTGESK